MTVILGPVLCCGIVSVQQLDPPDEELLSSALQCVEVELGKLTEIPWLYHILQPNDEEVSPAYYCIFTANSRHMICNSV